MRKEKLSRIYRECLSYNKENKFANFSGGVKGSDMAWDEIGRKYGFNNHFHIYIGKKTPCGNYCIESDQELFSFLDELLKNVSKKIQRKYPTKNQYVNNLLRRNFFQVYFTRKIFAISNLKENIVQGGTGWAVQIAIDSGKEIFVFDQYRKIWYEYNFENNSFQPKEKIPVLSQFYAGIGTRDINPDGIKAIHDVYQNTVNN